ncbi:ankyrin repeat-containing domain protein [Aspergillus varians]
MYSLLGLPNELLVHIAGHCKTKELSQLIRTCWRLHNLFNVHLYRRGLVGKPQALEQAVETRNQATAERFFEYTTPPPALLSTALIRVCERGDAVFARLLLDHGALPDGEPDTAQSMKGAPLLMAAIHRHLPLVEILLASGASPKVYSLGQKIMIIVHCTKLDGGSPAAPLNAKRDVPYDPRILHRLVQHGMDVISDPGIVGRALTQRCPPSVIGLLLDFGLDPNQPANVDERPLQRVFGRACGADEEECASFIRRCVQNGVEINARPPGGYTVLHMAVMYGRPLLVRTLIAAGADVNAPGQGGVTPLHVGPIHDKDNEDIIRALLDSGADMAAVDDAGKQRVLMRVINARNQPCMRLLLDRGIDLIPAVSASELMLVAVYLDDAPAVRRLLHECQDTDLM